MNTKKHADYPHLTGEHRWGDTGQLILFFLFLTIYISDSFFLQYSTFLSEEVSISIRIPIAIVIFICAMLLARGGLNRIFRSNQMEPGVIRDGVFKIVRHPIYLGAILFYFAGIIMSLSVISFALWIVIIVFYIWISKYEEKILTEEFGEAYLSYKNSVGMLFPKFLKSR